MPVWSAPQCEPNAPARPTLFIDRDGVLIAERDYLADPAGVVLVPGSGEAVVRAREAGYLVIALTNQSGIGRGYYSVADFDAVMTRLTALLAAEGARLDGVYYCPHAPEDGCRCRKPRTGLLDEAAAAVAWDPQVSWVIGDKGSDVALGQAAGLGSVLVRTGYGREQEAEVAARWGAAARFFVADDLRAAVADILAGETGDTP